MKIVYFVSLLIATLFFNACATPTPAVYSPEQMDSFAIPPSNDNNLFSPPKNGYARLIMYRDDNDIRFVDEIFVNYEINKGIYQYNSKDYFSYVAYEIVGGMPYERALCRLDNNSSCIVNIRAGNALLLLNRQEATTGMKVISFLAGSYGINLSANTQGTIFTPKNQHIYCIAFEKIWWSKETIISLRDKNTCLKEYKEMYKPKHRKGQERWLNKLIKKGDKRAYQE